MAIGHKLELRQGQSLVMTPQLQQAIKLLQLSNLELAEYLEEEMERNPLLDRAESDDGPAQEAEDVRSNDEFQELSITDGASIGDAEHAIDSDPDTLYGADDSPSEMQAAQAGGAAVSRLDLQVRWNAVLTGAVPTASPGCAFIA